MINKHNVWVWFSVAMALILLGIGLVTGVTYTYTGPAYSVYIWNNGQACTNQTITPTTNYTINFSIIPPIGGKFTNATVKAQLYPDPTVTVIKPTMMFPNSTGYTVVHLDGCGTFTTPEYVDDNNNETGGHIVTPGGSCSDWEWRTNFTLNYTYSPYTAVNYTYKISQTGAGLQHGSSIVSCQNKSNPTSYIRVSDCDKLFGWGDTANYTVSCTLSQDCIDSTNKIEIHHGLYPRTQPDDAIHLWENYYIVNVTSASSTIGNISILLNNSYLANSQTLPAGTNRSIDINSAYLNTSYEGKNWSLITYKSNVTGSFQTCVLNFTIEDGSIRIGNTTFFNITQASGTNWTRTPSFNYNYTCHPSRSAVGLLYVDGDLISFPSLTCDGESHIITAQPTSTTTGNKSILLTIVPAGGVNWDYFTDTFFYDLNPPTQKVNVTWNPTGSNGTISLQCNDSEYPTLLYNWTWNGALVERANYTNGTIKTNTSNIYLQNLKNWLNASCSDLFQSAYREYTIMNNSLKVTVYDENTGTLITENVTIEAIQNDTLETYNTVTGSKVIWKHNESRLNWIGAYSLDAFSTSYAKRNGAINFVGNENGTFSFYLANQSSTVTLTIVDKLTREPIENALIVMARLLGSEWSDVSSRYTDITGKAVFSYTPNIRYRFSINHTSYDDKIFYLDPIIFTAYTIELTPSNQRFYGLDYEDVTADIEPQNFIADQINYLNVTILSAKNLLNSYSISACYPGGCSTASGTANGGEVLRVSFNITGATTFDMVNLNITYNTDVSGTRTFNYAYPIQGATFGPYTWISNRSNPTGSGWVERTLLATIFLIIVVGMLTYVAGPLAGGVVGLMFLGIAAYLNFIPLWAIIGTVIVGIIVIGKRMSE